MMPYQVYQLYQVERPKSAAEIRRADEQLGNAADGISRLWRRTGEPIGILRASGRGQRSVRPARLASWRLVTRRRARVSGDQRAVACVEHR